MQVPLEELSRQQAIEGKRNEYEADTASAVPRARRSETPRNDDCRVRAASASTSCDREAITVVAAVACMKRPNATDYRQCSSNPNTTAVDGERWRFVGNECVSNCCLMSDRHLSNFLAVVMQSRRSL